MNLINIFLFYSILGNVFETIAMSFIDKTYISGFMNSIFTPIYGIAILIILFIDKKINLKNKIIKIIIEFIIFSLILGILELIGGILIELIFNKIYWNYENYKFNIGKYTSLETALLWSGIALITLYIIHPIYIKIEKHIPKFITIGLSFFFIINLIYIIIIK